MSDSTSEMQHYLDQPLDNLMQEFDLYTEQSIGTLRGSETAWDKIMPTLRQRVCVEGNWCERRQDARFDDPTNIVLALASMVGDEAMRFAVPALLIAVILFKRGIDRFCECAPIGAKKE